MKVHPQTFIREHLDWELESLEGGNGFWFTPPDRLTDKEVIEILYKNEFDYRHNSVTITNERKFYCLW